MTKRNKNSCFYHRHLDILEDRIWHMSEKTLIYKSANRQIYLHNETPCEQDKKHSGKMTAVETSTITLDVLHHRVGWRVTTINRATIVGCAACQPVQIDLRIKRHLRQPRMTYFREGVGGRRNIKRRGMKKRKKDAERHKWRTRIITLGMIVENFQRKETPRMTALSLIYIQMTELLLIYIKTRRAGIAPKRPECL